MSVHIEFYSKYIHSKLYAMCDCKQVGMVDDDGGE